MGYYAEGGKPVTSQYSRTHHAQDFKLSAGFFLVQPRGPWSVRPPVPTGRSPGSKTCLCFSFLFVRLLLPPQLGLKRFHGVGILGFNSAEWSIASVGAILAG